VSQPNRPSPSRSKPKPRVAVYGDACLDVSVRRDDFRPTQEDATVKVFPAAETADDALSIPGGAANLAANLAALGCDVTLYAPWPDGPDGDHAGRVLRDRLVAAGVYVVPHGVSDRTTVKTRYYAGTRLAARVDADGKVTEYHGPPLADGPYDAVVLSDYGKGAFPHGAACSDWGRMAGLAFADPYPGRAGVWAGAALDTLVVNWHEAEDVLSSVSVRNPPARGPHTDDATAALYAAGVAEVFREARTVVVKRGAAGSTVFPPGTQNRQTRHVRAHHPARVFDAQGAGDTYLAAYVTGRLRGLDETAACSYASIAAGVVVGKPGTAVVTSREVVEAGLVGVAGRRGSVFAAAGDAVALARHQAAWGVVIGYTNGCFDGRLHAGHRKVLAAAAARCDLLFVGVDSDARVRALKGPGRPVVPQAERAEAVAAVAGVGVAFVFDEDPAAVLAALDPDYLFKGGDYTRESMPEIAASGWGGEFVRVDSVPGESTTAFLAAVAARPPECPPDGCSKGREVRRPV